MFAARIASLRAQGLDHPEDQTVAEIAAANKLLANPVDGLRQAALSRG